MSEDILRERARVLARPASEEIAVPVVRVLRFSAGRESYAIETSHVRAVLRLTELTPLPDAPRHVLGIVRVRGEIPPLFDLRPLLGPARTGISDLSHVVIVGDEELEFGIVADDASEIADLPLDDIGDAPPSLTAANREIVRGVLRDATIVLAADALCRDPRLFSSDPRPVPPSQGDFSDA